MGEWITRRLREIGEMCGAGADKLSKAGEKPVRLVNYMDVYRHHRITGELPLQEVTATDHEITRYDLRLNDVLFTPSSETPDDIANAAVVGEDIPGAVYSYHLNRFRAHQPEAFDTDFLGYLFNSSQVQRYFWARASGLTRYTLNRSDFKNLPLFFPKNRKEQSAISTAIGSVDSAIAAARESIAKAERLQKALMQQLLTGRMRPDGSMRGKGEFCDSKVGSLPATWSVARIKDFGVVSTGKTPPTDNESFFQGEIPFITPGDMGQKKWLANGERYVSEAGAHLAGILPPNAVCVVCIGATIGKVGLTTRESCTNQQINSVVCSIDHDPEFLYYSIRHSTKRLQVMAGINATPQLNKSEFSKFRIPMPANFDEEQQIASILRRFDDLIAAKQTKIGALQRLKKALMQSLLTGRIRLPVEGEEDSHAETRRAQRDKACRR